MSRAEELRQRINTIQGQQAGQAEGTPAAARPRVATDRSKPVRRSVDLSPTHHRKLTEWCAEAATELGVSRVTGADAIRTLVGRLLTDETLARKVRADLADELNQR